MKDECRGGPGGRPLKNTQNDYPNRQSLRLKDYDYTQEGAYFITICTLEGMTLFDEYPALKNIIEEQWRQLPKRFSNIRLDEFVVMPNHVHGIIVIKKRSSKTIGDTIGAYKSLCVSEWIKHSRAEGARAVIKFWHRNFHERVIRNEKELDAVCKYIRDNPGKWNEDENNPKNWKK